MEPYYLKPTKSIWAGILLALLFGPFGLFYSSVLGGFIMTLSPILFIIAFGLGISNDIELLKAIGMVGIVASIILGWLFCIIWAAIAVDRYNKRIISESRRNIGYHTDIQTHEPKITR